MTTIRILNGDHKIIQAVKTFIELDEPACLIEYSTKDYINAASCAATIATSIRRNEALNSVCCRRRGTDVYLISTKMDTNAFKTIIERI